MINAIVTKELAIKAIFHGACKIPKVGMEISELSTNDLIWVEKAGFVTKEEKKKISEFPIWVLSGYGNGYGNGYGYGDGYGDGDGNFLKKEAIDLFLK